MKASTSIPSEQQDDPPEKSDIQQLCEAISTMPPEALSMEVRKILEDVLGFHGSVEKSMRWLVAPNNALKGQKPVDMIRAGNIKCLKDFWDEFAYRQGH